MSVANERTILRCESMAEFIYPEEVYNRRTLTNGNTEWSGVYSGQHICIPYKVGFKETCDKQRLIALVDKAKQEYANDVTDHTETEYIVECLLNEGVRI